jgi:hypothetical protein
MGKALFFKVQLIFIIVIFELLIGNIRDIEKYYNRYRAREVEDKITQHDRRFEDIRKILPPNGVVGYFTDKKDYPSKGIDFLIWTGYALSPLIVVRGTAAQFIIADISEAFNIKKFRENNNVRLIKNFGNGIVLFQKEIK